MSHESYCIESFKIKENFTSCSKDKIPQWIQDNNLKRAFWHKRCKNYAL